MQGFWGKGRATGTTGGGLVLPGGVEGEAATACASGRAYASVLARVSASRCPQEPIAAFAGGALPHTILSCCQGALLDMFNTRTVLPLRATCKDAAAAVAGHAWEDMDTVIHGHVGSELWVAGGFDPGQGAWRACFPRARCANVGQRKGEEPWENPCGRRLAVVDEDFVHFVGLRALNMRHCSLVTDAALACLEGIHTLDMTGCSQLAITDAGLAHLRGIHTLYMSDCSQPTITDAAFAHLRGIHTLDISRGYFSPCLNVSDAAFAHLGGIHTLRMKFCNQATVSDAAFAHLAGIQCLDMSGCNQATITDAAFAFLAGVHTLLMNGCSQATITEAALDPLAGIHALQIVNCDHAIQQAARLRGLPVVPCTGRQWVLDEL